MLLDCIFMEDATMKTNEQHLDEITAAMADTWLAACNRRVIVTWARDKHVVVDIRDNASLFGPASPAECQAFVHRAAALDVLRMLGTERVGAAAMVARERAPTFEELIYSGSGMQE
jgi:hypothetical protein